MTDIMEFPKEDILELLDSAKKQVGVLNRFYQNTIEPIHAAWGNFRITNEYMDEIYDKNKVSGVFDIDKKGAEKIFIRSFWRYGWVIICNTIFLL